MLTLKNIDVKNKKVILRVDYNVPIKDGKILDINKIVASLDTINYLLDNNAKIIIMSHLGKVKTEEDIETNTLLPVKEVLSKLLNKEILFSKELEGKHLEELVSNLKSKDILLLENTRVMDYPNKLESNCDEALSLYWSSLGEVYILDAFASSHRAHASTTGIPKYLPHAVGFLVEKEIAELDKIKNETKTLLLGGAKVSDKIAMIKNLLPTTDKVLVGGAMCATFLKSEGYQTGKTFVDDDLINECKTLIKTEKIVFPVDVVTNFGSKEIDKLTEDDTILDIGPLTIEMFKKQLKNKPLIIVNGTMGKYEDKLYENGTKEILNYLNGKTSKVIVLGGDAASAATKYNLQAYYKSTGGGASLEYLSGEVLPALKIMED